MKPLKDRNVLTRFCCHPIWSYSIRDIVKLVDDHWNNRIVNMPEIEVLEFHLERGECHSTLRHPWGVRAMAEAFADTLQQYPSKNYVECGFTSKKFGCITVTVQKCDGKSPHELRIESERERDALVTAAFNVLANNGGPIGPEGTIDGVEYVMVRRADFAALQSIHGAIVTNTERRRLKENAP